VIAAIQVVTLPTAHWSGQRFRDYNAA